MSGTKIDLDEIRDGQNFDKPKLIIEDLNLDDLLEEDKPDVASPVIEDVKFDDVGEKVEKSEERAKVVVSDTSRDKENEILPAPPLSTPREVVEAIKSAIKSSRKPTTPREKPASPAVSG